MRCPKCHYLGFDPEPRCRNCGYDLEVTDADLALHTAESTEDHEVPDLTLHERPSAAAAPVTLELVHAGGGSRSAVAEGLPKPQRPRKPAKPLAPLAIDQPETEIVSRFTVVDEPIEESYQEPVRQLDRYEAAEEGPVHLQALESAVQHIEPIELPKPAPFRAPNTTTELPLFVKAIADSSLQPLEIDVPVVPPTRPPLSVRRAAPEPVRTQARVADRRLGPLDHDLLEDLKRVEREETARDREHSRLMTQASVELAEFTELDESGDEPVEPRLRLAAAGIDIAVLGGIAGFVFWATLRLCNVTVVDVGWAALVPLAIFIGVMDLSYLVMFTAAGGQTVGKMLMGIRVISDDQPADEPVPMGRAAWRAALTMVSVVALGLGWLPALFGRGITLHDRLTHTHVVRA